jgi:hypothetical protein
MAIKPLNSVAGFSVGQVPSNVILGNGDIFTNNITVNNFANLGNVGNVYIGGGSNGQVLQTDGSGNLSWTSSANVNQIHNGNSNVTIPNLNGNVYINSNSGTDQQWNFTTSGNLVLPLGGIITEGSSPSGLGNTITLTPSGGSNTNQQLVIYPTGVGEGDHIHLTSGNLSSTSIFLGNDTQYIRTRADGSMVIGTDDGQPDTSGIGYRWIFDVDGNLTAPNVGTANLGNLVTANFANFYNDLYAGGNANIVGNLVVQGNIANANNISITNNLEGNTANFSGNITTLNANLGNLVTANYANFANDVVVQGNIANANNITVTNNITSDTANVTGNLISGNANLGNLATANNFSTNGSGGDITLTGGNVVGANVVIANSFTSNGGVVDFSTNNPNVQLGNVGNVHILGGGNGYVLQTDGAGNLSWSSAPSITEIQNGNSNVSIPDVNGNVYINANASVDQQWNFGTDGNLYFPGSLVGPVNGFATLTALDNGGGAVVQLMDFDVANSAPKSLLQVSDNVTVITDVIGSGYTWTYDNAGNTTFPATGLANLGNLVTANYANFTNDLVVQGNIANANNISVTNNITAGSANVTNDLSVGGNITTGTGSGGNISGVNYITANVANITDVVNTGKIANGTSNIRLDLNGNITLSSNNLSNVFTFSDLGANVIGYIQANGVISAGGFLGSNLVSNVGILSLQAQQAGGNYNINLLAGGNGNIDVGSTYITSLKNPISPDDAATKEYVDNISQGLFIHPAANVTSASNLTASYLNGGTVLSVTTIAGGKTITFSTNHGLVVDDDIEFTNSFNGIIAGEGYFVYSAPTLDSITVKNGYYGIEITTLTNASGLTEPALGNGGVGATLTNSGTQAALTIDNVIMTVGARVLVQGQTNQIENGIYDVTTVGTISTNWVLTRSSDGDSYQPKSAVALCTGSFFFIMDGDIYAGSSYVLTSPPGEIHIGTSNIVFSQFSAAGQYTGSNGISVIGTLITANVDNVSTAIVGGNIVVKDGAQLHYPNIGAATGTSLDLSGNVIAGNLNSNAMITTVDLNATGNIVAANLTSNAFITAVDGNLTGNLTVGGNITTTGATGNISGANVIFANSFTSNGGIVDFNTNNPNVQLGSNANVHLYGGSNGQVLQTDGSGNLNWYSISATSIQNGNSNVTIPVLDGNIYLNANSGTDRQWNFDTTGNLTAPAIGTANLGNLVVANYAQLTSLANTQIPYANATNVLVGTTNFVYDAPNQVLKVGAGGAQIGGDAGYGYVQAPTANIATSVTLGNTAINWGTLTSNTITANQTIATLSVTGVTGIEFLVKGIDSGGAKYSIATVQAVTDGTDVDFSTFGGVQLGGYTGSLAVNIDGSNISLQVTPASSNSTVWTTQYRII